MSIVGRQQEIALLEECLTSPRSEFVAVYGRRRVGKTFLVRETLGSRLSFHVTGVAKSPIRVQLGRFSRALVEAGGSEAELPDWFAAFDALSQHLSTKPGKKVIFLDEMPWLDTPRSGFLPALEWFWNGWASARSDIVVVVCGSATSWIVKKLFKNTGGLHNRVTRRVNLLPFTLAECREYYENNHLSMSMTDMLESYMIFGGIPYYLSLLQPGRSLTQNVDRLCFAPEGPLRDEFDNLYRSLFAQADSHLAIVRALAARGAGLTRGEVAQAAKISNGGRLTTVLDDLIQSGFVRAGRPYGRLTRGTIYQLVDFFTLFWLRFVERSGPDRGRWERYMATPAHSAWAGYAFERVCLCHLPQIKAALGIAGISADVSSWRSDSSQPGAQVDLVIDRTDRVVNLCEMKFAPGPYVLTKTVVEDLRRQRSVFIAETRSRKAIHLTMVTPYGLAANKYSGEVDSQVQGSDLFGPTDARWR